MEKTEGQSAQGHRKTILTIVIVFAVIAVLLAGLVVGMHLLQNNGSRPAPVMLAKSSHYEMYEDRGDTVLLTYSVTLRNDTGTDLNDFAMRATLKSDYESGYLMSPEASVRLWGEQNSTFSMAAGETRTMDLICTAKYHKTNRTASGDLPQLYVIYPDGSEGRVEIQDN